MKCRFCRVLASLNLPAAIEVTEGNTLPPSILEKAAAVRQLGGIEIIEQMLRELPELFKRNKDILDEVGFELQQQFLYCFLKLIIVAAN